MSATLTRNEDFRPLIEPMPSFWREDTLPAGRECFPRFNVTMETPVEISVANTQAPTIFAFAANQDAPTSGVAVNYPVLPAAFSRKSQMSWADEFCSVLTEAINFSAAMVADDEGAPLNVQTWAYAIQVIAPFLSEMNLSSPLLLPLQNGGLGAEWHDFGLNIELRFRNPYQVYAVIEDVRRVISPFHDFDMNLSRFPEALRELSIRKTG